MKITYSIAEASKVLGISKTNTYKYANEGLLPSLKIGSRILIPVQALEEFVRNETLEKLNNESK